MSDLTQQIVNLQHLVDAAAMRHRVVAQNIANVNTPGYHRLDVTFDQAFAKELQSKGVLGTLDAQIEVDDVSPERNDGNNVDIDREMADLNRNAMLHQTYLQLIAGRLGTLQHAIRG